MPFVILHGSADTVVSPVTCQTRVARAQALGATTTNITMFKDVHHSFDTAQIVMGTFTQADVDAKKAADAQVMRFFATHL